MEAFVLEMSGRAAKQQGCIFYFDIRCKNLHGVGASLERAVCDIATGIVEVSDALVTWIIWSSCKAARPQFILRIFDIPCHNPHSVGARLKRAICDRCWGNR